MEPNEGNIFQSQAQTMARANPKVGKPPTRLQKKAPSSLEVNYHTSSSSSSPLTPIPLLSPLIVSPRPLLQAAEEFRFPVVDGDIEKGGDNKKIASSVFLSVANGYSESSSLFAFFQSKCMLVDHAK
ncbi:uncharacterized protein LOC8277444 [Ricinus communis]|uniref:Uncharacterized protein n=1 Tax=Ricinus communis TaxID=3988 RepID=B9S1J9_RICCO|nr:uncharacterized protein LOC8277444 [Ricinus communis]EEF42468.1 conserved hypothetical protein [Ricinus communis]|eukprot:XP_025013222.1 uncharacterized protein LOC8277444 [Ricinus communis]